MSEIESRFVKQGLWVDLGQPPSMGKTITTDTRTGTFIVALLAVLSSLATAHLWFLITFTIHQFRANGRASDGLFRQQQVTLRALSPPSAVMMEYLRLYWYWRPNHLPKAKLRSFPLPILAALFTCATITLGVFSSYIVDTTNLQVLASSGLCGPINMSDTQYAGVQSNYTPIVQSLAVPLAQTCYTDNNTNNALCNIYPRSRVPFQVTREKCPWESAICMGQGEIAVSMDSGLLDVRNAFGLNLAPKDDVQFRKKTTCAVLSLDNRTTLIPATAYGGYFRPPLPEEQFLIYSFGDFGGNGTWNNATFVLSLVTTNVTDRYIARKYVSYVSPEWSYKGILFPLPEMKREDADLVLKLVVKNRVAYDVPVNDPLFSAHKKTTVIDEENGSNVTFYYSDVPASVVGCTQQYQFCVGKNKCTGLRSLPRRLTESELPGASSLQQAVLELLITSAYNFDISTPQTFQASSLMRVNGYINALPDDQWIQETIGWESNVWASLQIAIGDYATGIKARDHSADSYVRKPETEGEKQLCNLQKMKKSGGFVNINVFGLAFVFSSALLFVILDLTLLRFLVYLSRFHRTKWLGPRLERWVQDGVLQLQRRAYQADGQGPWKQLDAAVPVTTRAMELKDLPLEASSLLLLQDPKIRPSTYRATDATLTTVNEPEIVNVKPKS